MKQWFLLLLTLSVLFAASDWRFIGGMALITSAVVLALIYMIAYAFSINELKFLAEEEFYQLLATVFMVGLLVGVEAYINDLSVKAFGATTTAKATALLGDRMSQDTRMFGNLQRFSVGVGESASKSAFCSLTGVGVSMSTCGAYQGLTTPASFVYQMLGLAVAELGSLQALVKLGEQYAFSMLLPAGLLLRTFRVTRGAGGLVMAFAVSLYLLMPLSVIAMRDMGDAVAAQLIAAKLVKGDPNTQQPDVTLPSPEACAPFSLYAENYNRAKSGLDSLAANTSGYVYEFLVNTTLTTIIAITTLIVGVQQMAKAMGSEIDVSALARVA